MCYDVAKYFDLLHRFQISHHLFVCIMNIVEEHHDYFIQKRNAAGMLGLFYL
jgi:hypothetical protein